MTTTKTRTPVKHPLQWWNLLSDREQSLVNVTGNVFVRLSGTYRQDFGEFALLHLHHRNEALAYSSEFKVWVVLDCCGDLSNYPTFESAWAEFTSPFGHEQWLELKHCGQHRPDFYFTELSV